MIKIGSCIVVILLVLASACGTSSEPIGSDTVLLNAEVVQCSFVESDSGKSDEDGAIKVAIRTTFPSETRLAILFRESRDAVREPNVREVGDTIIAADTVCYFFLPPSFLPGDLIIYVPQEIQTRAITEFIVQSSRAPFDSVYCPGSLFSASYRLDFKDVDSQSDSLLIEPLEINFERISK